MSIALNRRVQKRLRPLYVAAFFQGFVLWYSIQILLAKELGMSIVGIGGVIAAMTLTTVLFEIPAGILADRWSRKGVLLLSSVAIIGSTLFGALATAPWHYLMTQILWGLFYAMYTGTYDAMVYDVLLEENDEKHYEYWFGRVGRYDSIALVTSSIAGGLAAGAFGVRAAYWLTLPAMVMCAAAMILFREPKVHKQGAVSTLLSHINETAREVTRTKLLWFYLMASLTMGAAGRVFFEFDQVWMSELGLPTVLFGLVNGSILASIGLRSVIVDRVSIERHKLLAVSLVVSLIFAALLAVPNVWVAATSLVGVALSLLTAGLVLNGMQQKHFQSRLRAGANSMVSSLTHVSFLPVSIVFGFVSEKSSISIAAWLPFCLVLASFVFALRSKAEVHTVNQT